MMNMMKEKIMIVKRMMTTIIKNKKKTLTTTTTTMMSKNQNHENTNNNKPYSVQSLQIRTCVGIYEQLYKQLPNIYPSSASSNFNKGVDLDIDYVDTTSNNQQQQTNSIKTIVAIHGIYGYHNHFDRLIKYFTNLNSKSTTPVRVIVPNLPDFQHTRTSGGIYWNSTEERLCFMIDLLKHLKVSQIDCLVCHSSGIQTALAMWEASNSNSINPNIKSLAIIAPALRPNSKLWSTLHFLAYIRNEWWYRLLELVKIHRLISKLFPLPFNTVNELLIVANIFLQFEHNKSQMIKRINQLVKASSPPSNVVTKVAIVYGDKDSLLPNLIDEIRTQFQIEPNSSKIVIVDSDKKDFETTTDEPLEKQQDGRITLYEVKNAGHMVHAKYSQFTGKLIENLIN